MRFTDVIRQLERQAASMRNAKNRNAAFFKEFSPFSLKPCSIICIRDMQFPKIMVKSFSEVSYFEQSKRAVRD